MEPGDGEQRGWGNMHTWAPNWMASPSTLEHTLSGAVGGG